MVIQALDGALVGAPYRDIAVASSVRHGVDREWNNRSRFLRDRVRRAMKRGRDLMNGWHLKFMR